LNNIGFPAGIFSQAELCSNQMPDCNTNTSSHSLCSTWQKACCEIGIFQEIQGDAARKMGATSTIFLIHGT
jgi:hypothetical protein